MKKGEGIASLRKVFSLADEIDLREGKLAYPRYHQMLSRLAVHYEIEFEKMVACFVALSPNNDYLKNLKSAVSIVIGYKQNVPVDRITVSTYNACRARAWRVLNGEPFLNFTEGLKTRSFYRNIVDPADREPVTIDGHMIAIWHGRYLRMKEAVRMTGHYEQISNGVKIVAYENELLANQVQSILWFTWKRIHKPVRGDGQGYLLDLDDQWRLDLRPEQIEPYPFK